MLRKPSLFNAIEHATAKEHRESGELEFTAIGTYCTF